MQAVEPPSTVTPPVAEVVVVSQETQNDLVLNLDTPLPLVKAGRTEDALLRQAIFVTRTLVVVRKAEPPNAEALRWTYQPFLQRQLCFSSMTGQFSCTVAEVTPLPDKSSGEAPHPGAAIDESGPPPDGAAEAARATLTASLRARGAALFREDRRLTIDPMLRASGVSVRPAGGTGAARR